MKRAGPFIWRKKTSIPFTKLCFVPSLAEISRVVLEKKIFYISLMYFAIFFTTYYLPLEKDEALHLNKLYLNLLHQRMLCAKFRNWQSGSGEEENVKSLWQPQHWRQRRTTDKLWSEKLTWDFGSSELKKDALPLFEFNEPSCYFFLH